MIAKTLSFGTPGKLTCKNNQLVWDGDNGVHRTFPMEDLGFVIIETKQIVVSTNCLSAFAANNVAVVICDDRHMPAAQLLPYAAHVTTQETAEKQLAATEAVNGRLWRQVCRCKIANQAELLHRLGKRCSERLRNMSVGVKNHDPSNLEGQAARIYFQELSPSDDFKRDPDGVWPNAALNYGYAILRAAVARSLVGSGLICLRGIHHHNRYNPFCLADDVMEPYRPFVDQYVFGGEVPFDRPLSDLTHEVKAKLLELLTCDVRIGGVKRPLQLAITYTTASLARYYRKESEELALPTFA